MDAEALFATGLAHIQRGIRGHGTQPITDLYLAFSEGVACLSQFLAQSPQDPRAAAVNGKLPQYRARAKELKNALKSQAESYVVDARVAKRRFHREDSSSHLQDAIAIFLVLIQGEKDPEENSIFRERTDVLLRRISEMAEPSPQALAAAAAAADDGPGAPNYEEVEHDNPEAYEELLNAHKAKQAVAEPPALPPPRPGTAPTVPATYDTPRPPDFDSEAFQFTRLYSRATGNEFSFFWSRELILTDDQAESAPESGGPPREPLKESALELLGIVLEKRKPTLVTLQINSHGLNVNRALQTTLARGLACCTLHVLNLANCDIDRAGCLALCAALTAGTNIIQLQLDDNPLGDEGAKALATTLIPTNKNLRCLSLKSAEIGPAGGEHLARSLRSTALYRLVLQDNPIGAQVVKMLSDGNAHVCSVVSVQPGLHGAAKDHVHIIGLDGNEPLGARQRPASLPEPPHSPSGRGLRGLFDALRPRSPSWGVLRGRGEYDTHEAQEGTSKEQLIINAIRHFETRRNSGAAALLRLGGHDKPLKEFAKLMARVGRILGFPDEEAKNVEDALKSVEGRTKLGLDLLLPTSDTKEVTAALVPVAILWSALLWNTVEANDKTGPLEFLQTERKLTDILSGTRNLKALLPKVAAQYTGAGHPDGSSKAASHIALLTAAQLLLDSTKEGASPGDGGDPRYEIVADVQPAEKLSPLETWLRKAYLVSSLRNAFFCFYREHLGEKPMSVMCALERLFDKLRSDHSASAESNRASVCETLMAWVSQYLVLDFLEGLTPTAYYTSELTVATPNEGTPTFTFGDAAGPVEEPVEEPVDVPEAAAAVGGAVDGSSDTSRRLVKAYPWLSHLLTGATGGLPPMIVAYMELTERMGTCKEILGTKARKALRFALDDWRTSESSADLLASRSKAYDPATRYDAHLIAVNLAFLDATMLDGIATTRDFMNKEMQSDLAHHSTQITYWVAHRIVSEEGMQDRLRVLSKFIDVAVLLQGPELADYQGFMAVMSALGKSQVARLKATWSTLEETAPDLVEKYRSLLPLVDPGSGLYPRLMDRLIERVSSGQPVGCVPFLGSFLTTLERSKVQAKKMKQTDTMDPEQQHDAEVMLWASQHDLLEKVASLKSSDYNFGKYQIEGRFLEFVQHTLKTELVDASDKKARTGFEADLDRLSLTIQPRGQP